MPSSKTIPSKNIFFIIDDDIDDQDLLKEALKEIDPNIQCYQASDGFEGMKQLRAGTFPRPGMIFVDLNMPRVNGRQFLVHIKNDAALKDIPVVVYTTSMDNRESVNLLKDGAAYFLNKPISFSVLKSQLKPLMLLSH